MSDLDKSILDNLKKLDGIGDTTAKKLISGGFQTITQLSTANADDLALNSGLPLNTANRIISNAREYLIKRSFITAFEDLQKRKEAERFTFGVKALDELIGGGIETKSTIEIAGEYRTGKTQIAHQICVTVQLPKERGGLDSKAIFLDCEKTFRPERIMDIAKRFELDPEKVLNNIFIKKIYSTDDLFLVFGALEDIIDNNNIKLLIVDSIISHLRSEFVGRETLSERQAKLSKMLGFLSKLADNKNIAVVYTNQVLSDPSINWGNPTKPTGGNIMAHAATFRIMLRKGKENTRIARLIDCSFLPEREIVYEITENGLEDFEKK